MTDTTDKPAPSPALATEKPVGAAAALATEKCVEAATPATAPGGGAPVYGVLGRTLAHSYSPAIYRALAGLDYRIFEREPEEVEAFVRDGSWAGMNVTIPYKRTVVPLMDELTPEARRLGNVNTILRRPDGTLLGHNTDYLGFKTLVRSLGIEVAGKRALVLGTGGAGATCKAVLADMGAHVLAVGRTAGKPGTDVTYGELPQLADAQLLVNATPVGMYPACPDAPVSLDAFPALEGLIDIVYNPARTALMLAAEKRGLPHAGGLLMLVAQAAGALELYTGEQIDPTRVERLTAELSASQQNIALIGMPGAGKTRVGQELARLLGREHADADWAFHERTGLSPAAYIAEHGESAFRDEETRTLTEVAARSQQVVSCGGGVVERLENYDLLHQNSIVVMLDRPLAELSGKGRPITQRDGVDTLAEKRVPLYRAWADLAVASRSCAEETARAVAAALPPML